MSEQQKSRRFLILDSHLTNMIIAGTAAIFSELLLVAMYPVDECTSSSTSASHKQSKPNSGMAAAQSNDALSRKRTAARQLPRIMLHPNAPQSDGAVNSLTTNDYSQEDNGTDAKKRSRDVGTHGDFTLSELSDSQSKSPLCYAKDSAKRNRTWPEVNNTVLIDSEQYMKLLTIASRLNEAKNYWKYEDLEEMREFVLSSGTEVCADNDGQRFMFSNWQYGTLHSKVQAGKVKLSESEAFSLFSKIVRGIAFCHACGIVVRDVKLRKFVFTDKQMTQLRLRDIFDVFVCEDIKDDRLRDRHSCPAYVAPEILKDSPEYAGRPADIWALGVLFYVLLFGSYPFNDTTPQRLFYRILKAKFNIPSQIPISQTARALIFGMLRKEPSERPTAEQLLYVPLEEQCLDDSNIISFRSILPGWLEIPSRIALLGIISNPAFEFARRIMKMNNETEDQVVPAFLPAVRKVQRHLQVMRDIMADSSLATAVIEENDDESSFSSSFLYSGPVIATTTIASNAASATHRTT
ncbi:CAMK/TRBL protein kinase [Loa loa]|uniref:CAMK/TRBL protein kinase n=1 Tax=Loa loa TaxID=7209 RepID=A0A1S0U267_LOALO|nr:CAMK/TRBL protein kinase [Loa loa]EFO24120.2 CAMK/TRBL protein kinase [Loa loa]